MKAKHLSITFLALLLTLLLVAFRPLDGYQGEVIGDPYTPTPTPTETPTPTPTLEATTCPIGDDGECPPEPTGISLQSFSARNEIEFTPAHFGLLIFGLGTVGMLVENRKRR